MKKGTKHTKETLKKLSEKHLNQHAWNKGKKMSTEYKELQKKSHINLWAKKIHPFLGKHHSDKSKSLIKKATLGRIAWNKNTKGLMPVPWNKGKTNTHTPEGIKSLKEHNYGNRNRRGKKMSTDSKRKMRESKIKYIEKTFNLGLPITPCIGKYEVEILNNLEDNLTYPITRQYPIGGYWLDGYCKALNLAIEIDEPAHKYKIKHDKEKEEYIKEKLHCVFLRIPINEG